MRAEERWNDARKDGTASKRCRTPRIHDHAICYVGKFR